MQDSDEIQKRRNENLIDYKVRKLEKICDKQEDRIRVLEDFKLESQVTHRNLVKWITIAATSLSAGISLLLHILFK